MTDILDHIARSISSDLFSQFRPTSPQHFFALRLAHQLNDCAAARHYSELSDRYSEAQLLSAYRRTKANAPHGDPARSFHAELERLGTQNGNGVSHPLLAAIRIERRAATCAIFHGHRLAFHPMG